MQTPIARLALIGALAIIGILSWRLADIINALATLQALR